MSMSIASEFGAKKKFGEAANRVITLRGSLTETPNEDEANHHPSAHKKSKLSRPHEFELAVPRRTIEEQLPQKHKTKSEQTFASGREHDLLSDSDSSLGSDVDDAQSEKEVKKLLWRMNLIGRWQSRYADWEWKYLTTKPKDYNFCIKLSIILLPILFVFTLWDILAATWFQIPHLSWIRHYGVLLPIHALCLPFAFYGYVMRQMYYHKTPLTRWAFIAIILHPILFAAHAAIDIIFNNYRDEAGTQYEIYTSGPDTKPFDFDPEFDYEHLKERTNYVLEF